MPNKVKENQSKNPFHQGEIDTQERAGASEGLVDSAQHAITNYLPEIHQMFLSKLPMVFIGAEDKQKNVWSSVLLSDVQLIDINDENNFTINSSFIDIDPLAKQLEEDSEIGLLGIEFETRRRNRISAKINQISDSSIGLMVKQCYGNCPKYIQRREGKIKAIKSKSESIRLVQFDDEISNFLLSVDSLFIASKHVDEKNDYNRGLDSSHRGGVAGFIQVPDEKTILIPDYIGNNFFNTIGNISQNPKVGLQFLDFENHHRLMLTGTAQVIWADDEELPFAGVDRMIRFTLNHGYHLKNSLPYTWEFKGYSPFSQAYSKEGIQL